MKYIRKPVIVEAITFDEFVHYGKENGANIVKGMPWSFVYKGHLVTRENDKCYIISNDSAGGFMFTPEDMLVTGADGEIYPYKIANFNNNYRAYGACDVASAEPHRRTRMNILDEAKHCVSGDREQDYGTPERSLGIIGRMWEVFIQAKCIDDDGNVHISGSDASALMVLFKMSRVATGHDKADNWIDAAGYAANGGELAELEK